MKLKHYSFLQLVIIFLTAAAIVSCSDSDDPVIDNPGSNAEVITQPLTDVIETYLDGDIAVVGDHFDETSSYILSRVQGQKYSIGINDAIPESVKYLLLDDQTVQNITAEDIDNFIIPAYRRGITICMHKPSDWKAAGILMGLWQVEWGEDGEDVADESQPMGAMQRTRATDDGMNDTDSSSDFWAMKPGGKTFKIVDVYVPDATYTNTEHITEYLENGDSIERDSIVTQKSIEPTPYQYGLFAEKAVKWLNDTESEVRTRATNATENDTYDNLQTIVINTTSSVTNYSKDEFLWWEQEHFYPQNFSAPMTLSVWTSMMYNFEKDEDYYSIVVTEDYDAGHIYLGQYFNYNPLAGYYSYATGLTWKDFEIRARWADDDYALRLQYDILPQGKASPLVTTEIKGWEVSADVSIGMQGVTGKPMAKISSEKKVTSIEEDVTLTNRTNIDGNWISWKYDFGHQPYYTGWLYCTGHFPPTNATCRSQSVQNQAWKWVVSNTQKRGNMPFTFDLKIASMERRNSAWRLTSKFGGSDNKNQDVQMTLDKSVFSIELPIPQRYKHIYSFTTDEIGDLVEFNNLMTALRSVSTNFNSLYNKLIRLDENGDPIGRTGVTYTALEHMVGKEWYALANDVQGKKIAVEKTYKFYVKDENGKLLKMIKNEDGQYKQVGVYLVIAPNGIRIEGGESIEYKVGDVLTRYVDDYEIKYMVTKKKEEVELMNVPKDFSGVLKIPSSIDGLKVTNIRKHAIYGCTGITGIELPTSLNHIDSYAFRGLNIESLEFPEGLTEISEWTVVSCDKLKKLVIPSTISKIGVNAFLTAPALREVHIKSKTPPTIVGSSFLPFNTNTTEEGKLYVPKGSLNAYRSDAMWGNKDEYGFVNIVEE